MNTKARKTKKRTNPSTSANFVFSYFRVFVIAVAVGVAVWVLANRSGNTPFAGSMPRLSSLALVVNPYI
jgi:hypothetical protein